MSKEFIPILIVVGIMVLAFSTAYFSLYFRNRRLSREIEELENERKSLIHRINVQREMMHDLASGDVGKKLEDSYVSWDRVMKMIPDIISIYRISNELKTNIKEKDNQA